MRQPLHAHSVLSSCRHEPCDLSLSTPGQDRTVVKPSFSFSCLLKEFSRLLFSECQTQFNLYSMLIWTSYPSKDNVSCHPKYGTIHITPNTCGLPREVMNTRSIFFNPILFIVQTQCICTPWENIKLPGWRSLMPQEVQILPP